MNQYLYRDLIVWLEFIIIDLNKNLRNQLIFPEDKNQSRTSQNKNIIFDIIMD